jgi:bifunctional polynucleotide phosphatase/kinase
MYVYAAMEDDVYRKPRVGMWTALLKELGVEEADQESFYVGDAAGRKATASTRADHTNTDL